ncbi:MAG: helix-turn-helix transcriptional regulator [Chitinophagales bacterium]|nr:helix-turn-helix transcriptional regulator [Chitinophagales bacterium]
MIRISLSSGEPLHLKPSPNRKFTGLRIPGSNLFSSDRAGQTIYLHLYKHHLFTLTLRQFQFAKTTQVITTEPNNWLRLEIPLCGRLSVISRDGKEILLEPGTYHLYDQPVFASNHAEGETCTYASLHFSPELLAGIGSDQAVGARQPGPVPKDLLEMLYDILKCPFQETLRDFYYANKVREILFAHMVSLPIVLPGELSPEQIAQMYEADRIMANNLDGKITIPELARRLGTNFVTLKKNYEKVFGIGLFPRLMQRKMEHIQLLLEKTNKPLKEIADLAGYQTLPGFINAFRKRFKVTPNDWRKERRGV